MRAVGIFNHFNIRACGSQPLDVCLASSDRKGAGYVRLLFAFCVPAAGLKGSTCQWNCFVERIKKWVDVPIARALMWLTHTSAMLMPYPTPQGGRANRPAARRLEGVGKLDVLRVAWCGRSGQYPAAKLIERYGPGAKLPDWRDRP